MALEGMLTRSQNSFAKLQLQKLVQLLIMQFILSRNFRSASGILNNIFSFSPKYKSQIRTSNTNGKVAV